MVSPRAKTLTKLLLLLGLPLALMTALFGWGVYTGHTHRHAVTSFERDWLGMDVEVPPPPAEPAEDKEPPPSTTEDPNVAQAPGSEQAGSAPAPSGSEGASQPAPAAPAPAAEDAAVGPAAAGGDPSVAAPPSAAEGPSLAEPAPGAEPPAPAAQPGADAALDPATRLHLPVVVQLKVLVDQDLIDSQPDWIDYIQRTVSAASLVYQRNFGIVLELVGVGRWPVATAGLDASALLQDLKGRSREGADVVVGFTDRSIDHRTGVRPEIPSADSPYNSAYAVVYANPAHPEPHLRTFLHELGHLFGAVDVDDPKAEAYRSGSWMSSAPVSAASTPWIDPENRERVLARKDKPFLPEARVAAGGH